MMMRSKKELKQLKKWLLIIKLRTISRVFLLVKHRNRLYNKSSLLSFKMMKVKAARGMINCKMSKIRLKKQKRY